MILGRNYSNTSTASATTTANHLIHIASVFSLLSVLGGTDDSQLADLASVWKEFQDSVGGLVSVRVFSQLPQSIWSSTVNGLRTSNGYHFSGIGTSSICGGQALLHGRDCIPMLGHPSPHATTSRHTERGCFGMSRETPVLYLRALESATTATSSNRHALDSFSIQ